VLACERLSALGFILLATLVFLGVRAIYLATRNKIRLLEREASEGAVPKANTAEEVAVGKPDWGDRDSRVDVHLQELKNRYDKFYDAGLYDAPLVEAKRIETAVKTQWGTQNVNYAVVLELQAQAYLSQGKYSEAEALYKRALVLEENTPDALPNPAHVARTADNLALVYWHCRTPCKKPIALMVRHQRCRLGCTSRPQILQQQVDLHIRKASLLQLQRDLLNTAIDDVVGLHFQ
jgi:tetratricopeptide (TPR) repeat protein